MTDDNAPVTAPEGQGGPERTKAVPDYANLIRPKFCAVCHKDIRGLDYLAAIRRSGRAGVIVCGWYCLGEFCSGALDE